MKYVEEVEACGALCWHFLA